MLSIFSRHFSRKVSKIPDADAMRKIAEEHCKKLGVSSISGPLKIVKHATVDDKNVVLAKKYYRLFPPLSKKEKKEREKSIREAFKDNPYPNGPIGY